MKELDKNNKIKQSQKKKSPKNINRMAQQRATEDELDIPTADGADQTVMMPVPTKKSKKERE